MNAFAGKNCLCLMHFYWQLFSLMYLTVCALECRNDNSMTVV